MIISEEIETHDDRFMGILYEKGVPKETDIAFVANESSLGGTEYLRVRKNELLRLKKEVLEGNISPVKLLIEYHIMDEKDVAARVKIPYGKFKKYLTIEGFKKIDVETLIKLAKVFDIGVADFFQFINIDKTSRLETVNFNDRIIQEIVVK